MKSFSQNGGLLRFLGRFLFCAAEILKTPPEYLLKTKPETGFEQIRTSARRLYHIYCCIAKTEKSWYNLLHPTAVINRRKSGTENSPS
jgi:hypothetical protein